MGRCVAYFPISARFDGELAEDCIAEGITDASMRSWLDHKYPNDDSSLFHVDLDIDASYASEIDTARASGNTLKRASNGDRSTMTYDAWETAVSPYYDFFTIPTYP